MDKDVDRGLSINIKNFFRKNEPAKYDKLDEHARSGKFLTHVKVKSQEGPGSRHNAQSTPSLPSRRKTSATTEKKGSSTRSDPVPPKVKFRSSTQELVLPNSPRTISSPRNVNPDVIPIIPFPIETPASDLPIIKLESLMVDIGAGYKGLTGPQKELWRRLGEDVVNQPILEISKNPRKLHMTENIRNRMVEFLLGCFNTQAAVEFLAMCQPLERAKALGHVLTSLKTWEQSGMGLGVLTYDQRGRLNVLVQETADKLVKDENPLKQKDLRKLLISCSSRDRTRVLAGLMLSPMNRSDAVADLLVELKGSEAKGAHNYISFQRVFRVAVAAVNRNDPFAELTCLAQITAKLEGRYSSKVGVGRLQVDKKWTPDAAVRRACDGLQNVLSEDQVESILRLLPSKEASRPAYYDLPEIPASPLNLKPFDGKGPKSSSSSSGAATPPESQPKEEITFSPRQEVIPATPMKLSPLSLEYDVYNRLGDLTNEQLLSVTSNVLGNDAARRLLVDALVSAPNLLTVQEAINEVKKANT